MIEERQGLPLAPLEEIRDLLHFRGLTIKSVGSKNLSQFPYSLESFLASGDFLKSEGRVRETVYLLEPSGRVEVSPVLGLSQVEKLSEGVELLLPVKILKLQASQASGKELLRGLLIRQGFKDNYLMKVEEKGQDLFFELQALPEDPLNK